jgi:hypothetical protein
MSITARNRQTRIRADQDQVGGDHYKRLKVTPWEALEAWMPPEEFKGYLKGNAVKYLARSGKKGPAREDVQKAIHYLQKLNEILNNDISMCNQSDGSSRNPR